jgi:hypothetical protein
VAGVKRCGFLCRQSTTDNRRMRRGACRILNSNQRTDLAISLSYCSHVCNRERSGCPHGCADHQASGRGRDTGWQLHEAASEKSMAWLGSDAWRGGHVCAYRASAELLTTALRDSYHTKIILTQGSSVAGCPSCLVFAALFRV